MGLLVILSVVLGLVLIVLAWIVMHLRRQSIAALATTLDELRTRQDALEATIARVETSRPVESAPSSHPGPPPSRRSTSAVRRVDAAEPSAVTGPTLIAVPSLAAASIPSTSAVTNDLGRRFGPIWDLADTGAAPDAIARSTGQPIGQVELILALRRQLAANANGGEPRLS
jgi:hypothetical protein